MGRFDEKFVDRRIREFWRPMGLEPGWNGPVKNWRWRLLLAYKALRGYECNWRKAREIDGKLSQHSVRMTDGGPVTASEDQGRVYG